MDNDLPVINLHELINTEWPEEIFVDGGLLSRGDKLLLGADSKAGKSTLLAQFLRKCTQAQPFLGFNITKPLKILFMQAELREKRLKERMMATSLLMPVEAREKFIICSTRGMVMLNNQNDLDKVKRLLNKVKPDIWCVDPMANFHDKDENSSTEMMEFFRVLDKTKEEFNLALVMSTHFRKGKKSKNASVLEMIRGSSALRGWPDTIIAIEGRQGDKCQHLAFELRNSDTIHKRILYYDRYNKEFKWEDPIEFCYTWAKAYIDNDGISTNQFIDALLTNCGDKLSNNRAKAFDIKNHLVSEGLLYEEEKGRSIILKVSNCLVLEEKALDKPILQGRERERSALP